MSTEAAASSASVTTSAFDNSHEPLLRLSPIAAIVLALLAGAIVYAVYQAAFPIYDVPRELMRMFPSDEDAVKREIAKDFARTLHAVVALSIFGALLAAFLGFAEAVARQQLGSSIPRLLSGVIIATILAAIGAVLGAQTIIRLEPFESLGSMERTVMGQILMFGALGAGVGFCVGAVGNNRRLMYRCTGAGITAGILAGVLFPVIAAFALPRVQTDVVIPDGSGGIFGCVNQPGKIGLAAWFGTAGLLLAGLIKPIANRRKTPKSEKIAAESTT